MSVCASQTVAATHIALALPLTDVLALNLVVRENADRRTANLQATSAGQPARTFSGSTSECLGKRNAQLNAQQHIFTFGVNLGL